MSDLRAGAIEAIREPLWPMLTVPLEKYDDEMAARLLDALLDYLTEHADEWRGAVEELEPTLYVSQQQQMALLTVLGEASNGK